jgi:hypothetical protein
MPRLYGYELQRGLVSLLVATTGIGKSTFEIGNTLAMVTNRALMGRKVWDGPLRVWYWNLEDDGDHLARQIQAACLHWCIQRNDIGDRLFIDSAIDGAELKIAIQTTNGAEIQRPIVGALVAELIARRIDVLIVDPFVACHSVTENDNAAMEMVVKEWVRVASAAHCAIRLVTHTRKLGGFAADIESARGGGALAAGARSGVVLNRMTKEEGRSLGIDNPRRFLKALDDKPNRAPPAESADWFEMKSIDLGNATSDRPSDLVGVAAPWSPPDPFDDVKVDHLRKVQAKIADGKWREHYSAKDWAGLVVAEVLGLDINLKENRDRVKSILKRWIHEEALSVVELPDANHEKRPHVVVGRPVGTG